MDKIKAKMEIIVDDKYNIINLCFQDIGEIKQIRISNQSLFNRIFKNQIRTWKKNGEEFEIDNIIVE